MDFRSYSISFRSWQLIVCLLRLCMISHHSHQSEITAHHILDCCKIRAAGAHCKLTQSLCKYRCSSANEIASSRHYCYLYSVSFQSLLLHPSVLCNPPAADEHNLHMQFHSMTCWESRTVAAASTSVLFISSFAWLEPFDITKRDETLPICLKKKEKKSCDFNPAPLNKITRRQKMLSVFEQHSPDGFQVATPPGAPHCATAAIWSRHGTVLRGGSRSSWLL